MNAGPTESEQFHPTQQGAHLCCSDDCEKVGNMCMIRDKTGLPVGKIANIRMSSVVSMEPPHLNGYMLIQVKCVSFFNNLCVIPEM